MRIDGRSSGENRENSGTRRNEKREEKEKEKREEGNGIYREMKKRRENRDRNSTFLKV